MLTLRGPYCVVTEGSVTTRHDMTARHRHNVAIDNPAFLKPSTGFGKHSLEVAHYLGMCMYLTFRLNVESVDNIKNPIQTLIPRLRLLILNYKVLVK
jgi:hypothetical protein